MDLIEISILGIDGRIGDLCGLHFAIIISVEDLKYMKIKWYSEIHVLLGLY